MTAPTGTHHTHHYFAHGFHPLGWITEAFATRRQRVRLEELDPHLLADIGIDPSVARYESHRPFWDLP